ncbi:MAG TPA: hypothetical protein VLX11_08400 [Candidatus Acidoferrales bacterium]|nr:hypothetical protein [Candidatus Acidoferrales bacterium]
MRFLLRLLFLFVLLLGCALVGGAFLAIDDHPSVQRDAEITPGNIERAKRILESNDPRKLKVGARRTVSVNQGDFDLAVNYLVHRYARGSARATLDNGSAQISASVPLPKNPIGPFVNIEAAFTGNGSIPRFDYLRIGAIRFPGVAADWLLDEILTRYLGEENYTAALHVVKATAFSEGKISVTYEWQSNLPGKLRTVLLPPEDQDRLLVYARRLAEAGRLEKSANISLADLMVPLFALAAERSKDGDAIAENRAVILVLTFYVNGRPLATLLPAAKNWPQATPHEVLLNRRDDFAKHFIVSAALAAYAGTPLSDAVGVYKEISDSRGGSGFSFNDIAADRAGTRFGDWAVRSPASARRLQERIAIGIAEREIMPATEDLPEFMPEPEFKRRFGGIDAPAYKKMMAEIDRRIAVLAFYR